MDYFQTKHTEIDPNRFVQNLLDLLILTNFSENFMVSSFEKSQNFNHSVFLFFVFIFHLTKQTVNNLYLNVNIYIHVIIMFS